MRWCVHLSVVSRPHLCRISPQAQLRETVRAVAACVFASLFDKSSTREYAALLQARGRETRMALPTGRPHTSACGQARRAAAAEYGPALAPQGTAPAANGSADADGADAASRPPPAAKAPFSEERERATPARPTISYRLRALPRRRRRPRSASAVPKQRRTRRPRRAARSARRRRRRRAARPSMLGARSTRCSRCLRPTRRPPPTASASPERSLRLGCRGCSQRSLRHTHTCRGGARPAALCDVSRGVSLFTGARLCRGGAGRRAYRKGAGTGGRGAPRRSAAARGHAMSLLSS